MSVSDAAMDGRQLQALRERWRADGQRVVFTNGCFDLLHVGHLRYLRSARALGDRLVIALNDDASTRGLKGPGRPILPFEERAELLAGLRVVDAVVGFGEPTALNILRMIAPDIYVKGGDYDEGSKRPPEADLAESLGARVVFLPFVEGRSTSAILEQIRDERDIQ